MLKAIAGAIVGLLLVVPAQAQKPVGLFGVSCADRPSWAAFGALAEWDDFAAAAACSRQSGMTWVLSLHHALPAHVAEVRARAASAGLLPHVVALTYREEWYEHYRYQMALPDTLRTRLRGGGDEVTQINRVRDYLTEAHATIRQQWPGPLIAWVAPYVNDSLQFGSQWYAPMPGGVDVLALDPYATAHQSFAQWQEIVFQHAVNTTTLPIAIIPQWFTMPGTTFSHPRDFSADYRRWMQHPRVVAMWGFLWASRPGIVGLRDIPALRASVELTLGVR